MIYIDNTKLNLPKDWVAKSDELLASLVALKKKKAERDEIIDKVSSQKHWKALKKELKKLSFGKCWYSEAREIYSHYHIDHFRPKKRATDDTGRVIKHRDGYWWLTFNWKNYRLSGGVGNTSKLDHFAVKANLANTPESDYEDEIIYLLDPTKKNDPKKLTFNEDGSICPINTNVSHWDHIRAKYTIEKLDLNYSDLKAERQVKWSKMNSLIEEINLLDIQYQNSPSAKKEAVLESKLEEVRKLIAPCEELSSTSRACLRASRQEWALALLEENLETDKYCNHYKIKEEEDDNDNE